MVLDHHTRNEAKPHRKAETEAGGKGSFGLPHPHQLCPHQIMDLRVTEVQHQLPHQCHQGLTDLEVPGIQIMADDATGSLEAM